MGVFDNASNDDVAGREYVCLSCEQRFDVQYHACPACGGYDVRRAKWVTL
jgi:rRNA maturation endonuclease Nob1